MYSGMAVPCREIIQLNKKKVKEEGIEMKKQMEVRLKTERKPEAVAILHLLNEMTPTEQQEMLVFMQGVRFAKSLEQKSTAAKLV